MRLLVLATAISITTSLAAAEELSPAKIAQKALLERGYKIGVVDGMWGRRSISAMTDLQKRLGLPLTGQPDALTLQALSSPSRQPTPHATDQGGEQSGKTIDAVSELPTSKQSIAPKAPTDTPPTAGRDIPPASSVPGNENALRREPASIPTQTEPFSNSKSYSTPQSSREDANPTSLLVFLGLSAATVYLLLRSRARRRAQTARIDPSFEGISTSLSKVAADLAAPVDQPLSPPPQMQAGRDAADSLSTNLRQHNAAVADVVRSRAADGQFEMIESDLVKAVIADLNADSQNAKHAAVASGSTHGHGTAVAEHVVSQSPGGQSQEVQWENVRTHIIQPETVKKQASQAMSAASNLREHNARVSEVVNSQTTAQSKAAKPGWSSLLARATPARSSVWKSAGQEVMVGGRRLTKGLVYVGEQLKPQNGWLQRDNCLIVPSLQVAAVPDVSGQYLDYWPSYERLSPSCRAAYLDWLASDRSNPATPIGYVFLYFYGLERRLMLDRAPEDRDAVIDEVERLVSVYGENRSFNRYSAELIGAARAFEVAPDQEGDPQIGLGDLPVRDKIELGRRASLRKPIPPALLLSLAANHPETRLKAPVRRLPHLVYECFCTKAIQDHPDGLIVTLPRNVRALEVTYRAASSTFEVPVVDSTEAIPDIAQLPQPLGYAKELLAKISDQLDEYSREVGKANGAPATLMGLSKLPVELRARQAAAVAGDALRMLDAIAQSREIHSLKDLLSMAGLKTDVSTKVGLRDLSRCLGGWGFGLVPDPHFVPKILSDRSGVLVFRFDMTKPVAADPSEEYRLTYVTLALGVVIAQSDGRLSEPETRFLSRLILETPGLADQERRRLVADLAWLQANPLAVSDFKEQLRTSTAAVRTTLLTRLISVAAADGVIDPGEVAVLEHLAKTLGLDPSCIYDQLHSTHVTADEVPLVVAAELTTEHDIPAKARQPGGTVNAERLAAIRAETAMASGLLGEIFDDEEEGASQETSPAPAAAGELDQRHRALLEELLTQPQWPRGDFDRLVRQLGLMPGSVMSRLNDWSIDLCDELVLEGDDPIVVNSSAVLESA